MIDLKIVPKPSKIDVTSGFFVPQANLAGELDRFNLEMEIPAVIETLPLETAGEEEYVLEIREEKIALSFGGRSGLFYGIQTLKQMLRCAGTGGTLPCCRIEDRPVYPERGVLYDISRDRVPTMDTLYFLVDLWTELKFNRLQLYTEHTFAYSGHKKVWKDASPMTPEEIRGLSAYCRSRGMELVPNQNSFGHMERWLVHPEYHYLAESPEGFTDHAGVFWDKSSCLSPAVDESPEFLAGLYDELLVNFDSEYINIGGDEPWELGMGKSKELCGHKGSGRVYLDFIRKIHRVVGERGKKIQVYADILMQHPELVKELPEDILLINWGYEASHPFWKECDIISRSGREFYVCTGTSSWNSLAGRWSNTRENILNGAVNGIKNGARGFIISEWGDNGHWQQLPAGMPGWFFAGNIAWNPEGAGGFDPEEVLSLHLMDGDRDAAEALMLLQKVWESSGLPLHNVSLPAVVLLDPVYPYYRKAYRMFSGYRFEKELELLDRTDELLAGSGNRLGTAADRPRKGMSMFRRELALTSGLLRLGCRLGTALFALPEMEIGLIPEDIRGDLAGELDVLMEEYRVLWNRRSRPGGLKESAGRMEALKKVLES